MASSDLIAFQFSKTAVRYYPTKSLNLFRMAMHADKGFSFSPEYHFVRVKLMIASILPNSNAGKALSRSQSPETGDDLPSLSFRHAPRLVPEEDKPLKTNRLGEDSFSMSR